MQGSRLVGGETLKKPEVILDDRFPFTENLNVGDTGQLEVVLSKEGERLKPLEDGTELLLNQFRLINAEPLMNKSKRVL